MRYSLKKQRGFIYLTTGANGTGKTLFTLEDVRKRQVEEGRPVYYHGFDMVPEYEADFGWKKFDPVEWEQLPKGSLIIMDEVHNQMPKRHASSTVPGYVKALGEHRKHGFDFYMLSQHPSNLDPFLIKIIGAPGHHRHIKRPGGAQLASVLTWNSVNMNCEKPSSGNSGEVSMRAYPKEVYKWYTSAVMHTGKRRIPKQVWVLAAAAIIVPIFGYLAVQRLPGMSEPDPVEVVAGSEKSLPGGLSASVDPAGDYLSSYVPRVPGLAHTAPRYDEVTAPVQAPYPAACVIAANVCRCYSQQGTKLAVPGQVCAQIVDGGFFIEWQQQQPGGIGQQSGEAVTRFEGAMGSFPVAGSSVPAKRVGGDVTLVQGQAGTSVNGRSDADVMAFMRQR